MRASATRAGATTVHCRPRAEKVTPECCYATSYAPSPPHDFEALRRLVVLWPSLACASQDLAPYPPPSPLPQTPSTPWLPSLHPRPRCALSDRLRQAPGPLPRPPQQELAEPTAAATDVIFPALLPPFPRALVVLGLVYVRRATLGGRSRIRVATGGEGQSFCGCLCPWRRRRVAEARPPHPTCDLPSFPLLCRLPLRLAAPQAAKGATKEGKSSSATPAASATATPSTSEATEDLALSMAKLAAATDRCVPSRWPSGPLLQGSGCKEGTAS